MGFLIAFGVIMYICFMGYMFYKWIDDNSIGCLIIAFVMLVLMFGAIIQGTIEENKKGPCVKYETQMHFNPATKTTMPARVCVLRGEWIE